MVTNGYRFMAGRRRPILISDRAAARWLGVSAQMVHLWVHTGAWPLPRNVRSGSWLFEISDVELWIKRGVWPADVHFRFGSPRHSALIRSACHHEMRHRRRRESVPCLAVS
jgi:hypothetical protein